ncbi:MAG: low molecular weight phosphotyrosine protein phosphatase [Nitrospirae bacterium]|nr:low molecular weight phosphotyrosine protein phosphatase [Nitrospirota bacterium]MDE3041000.1 low molecular weight phosphotyrosine protein phosphatase [Nitrospirota bacterium]
MVQSSQGNPIMNAGQITAIVDHCWIFLRGLGGTVAYLVGQMNVFRRPYERWGIVRLPNSIQSVLFVCKANICRSPLAAAYFQSLVEKEGRQMTVRSAGLETTLGKSAHDKAKAVALQQRLSLDEHATTQVHKELVDQSDLIVVMEIVQKVRIHRLYPRSKGKVVLLGQFDSAGSLEIADPYSGTSEDFQFCFQQMSRCCDVLAARLGVKS